MSLTVLHPGLMSLLVDVGRPRSRSLGVPLGGASDRTALALGNALVGNASDALALEVTLAGPTVEAQHPTACVVFGAPFSVTVDGHAITPATTFTLSPGDVLRIGGAASGARGYLCVAGGFDGPEALGSRSGLAPLAAGDTLVCPPSRCEPRALPFVSLIPDGGPPTLLRVLDGPQRDWFTDDRFFVGEYEVTPTSNRMGLRLKGDPLIRRPGELVSEAVAPGAVQITNDGLPIVLGVDGQTIGGYPKVAHVIRADLDRLAQLRPGTRVRFVKITADEAESAATEQTRHLRRWLARLQAADRCPVVIG